MELDQYTKEIEKKLREKFCISIYEIQDYDIIIFNYYKQEKTIEQATKQIQDLYNLEEINKTITLRLTEEEIIEFYGFCKGIIIQHERSEQPFISFAYKCDEVLEKIVSQETKAETSITLQGILNATKNDLISREKFENGFLGLIEKAEEEKNKLQDDINNL